MDAGLDVWLVRNYIVQGLDCSLGEEDSACNRTLRQGGVIDSLCYYDACVPADLWIFVVESIMHHCSYLSTVVSLVEHGWQINFSQEEPEGTERIRSYFKSF